MEKQKKKKKLLLPFNRRHGELYRKMASGALLAWAAPRDDVMCVDIYIYKLRLVWPPRKYTMRDIETRIRAHANVV